MTREPSLGSQTRSTLLAALESDTYDVAVIGGGIGAACAAWDASLRGLKVALIERLDFGAGTSAHSFKILHGGIRYLQHLDITRLRESCHERMAFMNIAPHLTRAMPVAVPTFGLGMQSRWVLAAAFAVLELLTLDRNRGIQDPSRGIPRPYLLSRRKVLELFPGLARAKPTGAGVFFDGQILNPPRAILAIIRAAVTAGATVANYCEARDLGVRDGRVETVRVRDLLGGRTFDLRARVVVNATGPFAPSFLNGTGKTPNVDIPLSRDMAVVVRRSLHESMAVAVQTRYADPDAVLSRGNRHIILAPWRGKYTLIGVNSRVYRESPYELTVTEAEIDGFLEEINEAYPSLALTRDDIELVNAGLLPFGDNEPDAKDLSFGKRSHVIDHASDGVEGLITGMSVRWTMGRLLGKKVIDLAETKLGRQPAASRTDSTPVWGGKVASVAALEDEIRLALPPTATSAQVRRVASNYGADWRAVINPAALREGLLPQSDYYVAEVRQALRAELAATLNDVVMRRLDLGSGECPHPDAIAACSRIAAEELGWDESRREAEVQQLLHSYPFAGPGSQYPVTAQRPSSLNVAEKMASTA